MKRILTGALALAVLTGCTATSNHEAEPTETEPAKTQAVEQSEQHAIRPELPLTEALSACATEIDSVVFLDAMYDGASNADGFDPHYSTEYATVDIVDGEWYFTYYPTHEDITPVSCHTDGTELVSMSRVDFENAMGDRTYTDPDYTRVATPE